MITFLDYPQITSQESLTEKDEREALQFRLNEYLREIKVRDKKRKWSKELQKIETVERGLKLLLDQPGLLTTGRFLKN